MDGVQLSQGYKTTTGRQYFLPLGYQKFLVLIWSISERSKVESTLEPPNGIEPGTFTLGIKCINH